MKIIFLGTNGWYDTRTGNTICTLIETKKYSIILDAGNGIYKFSSFFNPKKPVYLFLSHFHLDHIIGLHTLAKFQKIKKIKIFGQTGTRKILNTFINPIFSMPFEKLPFKISITELAPGKHKIPFLAETMFMRHSTKTLGFRFTLEGKTITYAADTGLCANAIKLADNADALIAECTLNIGESSSKWPHLNPKEAAFLAKKSNCKKLLLTHFDASRYTDFAKRKTAEKCARKIFKNTTAAKDNLVFSL